MKYFPKKYTTKDLQRLEQEYLVQNLSKSQTYSLFSLPSVQSLHLGHFYGLYTKDFSLKKNILQQGEEVHH